MTTRTTSTVLVGREAESAALRDALKRTRVGESRTVLVGGEAGIGKTRLVEEFTRLAAADGVRVLTGHCLELGEEGLPFAPFAAALRDLIRSSGRDALAGRERELSTLLPELGAPAISPGSPASPSGLAGGSPSGQGGPGQPGNARGHLFDVIARVFEELAAVRPLVLVVEDLHWADRSTRDLLTFLIRTERAERLLMVVTYRTDEMRRGHPLRQFLGELDRVRGVERVDVERLDRDGTADILANLLAQPPASTLIRNIHDRAQGNPFFIEELAATTSADSTCAIPETLRDLLLSRVDQLPEASQRSLRIAAAGGTRVGHALLVQVSDLPDAELEEALRAAVLAQLVVADPDGAYVFRHALVREAVHDDLLPGEHARLHARYAAAIEADPALVGSARAPVEIAHHWHAAGDRPRALDAALAAAHDAGCRYAYAEQSRLLDRVLELWEQVGDAGPRSGLSHVDLLESALTAAIESGDHARAMKLTRAALSEVDQDVEPARAARLLLQRGILFRTFGKNDGLEAMGEARELAGRVEDSWERTALIADLARAIALVDRETGGQMAQEAATMAADLGDTALRVSASVTFGRVFGRAVAAETGLAEMRRAAERANAAGEVGASTHAMINISDVEFQIGRYAESRASADIGLAGAEQIGALRITGSYLLCNLAEALIALGQWDEADASAARVARLDPPGSHTLLWLLPQATVRLRRGQVGADDLVDRALSFLPWNYLLPSHRLSLNALRIEAGMSTAETALAALADPALANEPRYAWPLIAASAHAFRDDPAVAARVRGLAEAVPAEYPAERAYAGSVAALLSTVDDPAVVLGLWREAVAGWRADGQQYQLAGALVGLAEAAGRAGDRATVTDAIGEAGILAGTLDATPLRDELTTLARRLGLRGAALAGALGGAADSAGGTGARPASGSLTDRELEVLRLVADGRSNRGIAELLYISPKTASVHVSRIIAKLDVHNRVEAAAVARRLGLLT